MQQHRRHFTQAAPLNQRLTQEAQHLRKEDEQNCARIRRARQSETAAHMQEWLASPGLSAALMPTGVNFARLGILSQGRTR
jgi:hypothetical protein